jgi:MYXO-CTERM domain-containing protein
VFPKTYQATTTPAALDAARGQLAALILHALGKDVQPAPGPTPCTTTACTDPVVATPEPAVSGFPSGGCSSSGVQSIWLAVPVLALFALRRRRNHA